MKVVIKLSARDDAQAWALLLRHSPGIALPDRTFIVSEEAVHSLQAAKLSFVELARGADVAAWEGTVAGERI